MNYQKGTSPSPTQPRGDHKLSQRGLLSIAMLAVSLGALTIATLGGARLLLDVFGDGLENSLPGLGAKMLVIGLAYMVGWLTAMVTIRVYGNLVLPFLIYWIIWGCLGAVCVLYLLVLQRLYMQKYDMLHYIAYLMTVGGALGAMVGLHLIIEDHDLRPLSIPLLIISLFHLGLIVYRYVYRAGNPGYVVNDLVFFFIMSGCSIFMLAHLGLLESLRMQLTNFFDRNSKVIRTRD